MMFVGWTDFELDSCSGSYATTQHPTRGVVDEVLAKVSFVDRANFAIGLELMIQHTRCSLLDFAVVLGT